MSTLEFFACFALAAVGVGIICFVWMLFTTGRHIRRLVNEQKLESEAIKRVQENLHVNIARGCRRTKDER